MSLITVAICTYNRAERLSQLVSALRAQRCPISFEILTVDNNSSDNTHEVLSDLAACGGAPLRYVREVRQGIVYARNRAIEEAHGTYLAFIDDDETPDRRWLEAAVDALEREEADCAGGEIRACLPVIRRPAWLEENLMGFLGDVRYGSVPFWITDRSTPVWSGNVAYRMSVFSDGLRFDHRYNREGEGIGGGEDEILFKTLLERRARIRYRPDMVIDHHIDRWKLKRRYFLKLHFIAGRKYGLYSVGDYERAIMGIPLYMFAQAARQWGKALIKFLKNEQGMLRQAMNGAHATGMIIGRMQR